MKCKECQESDRQSRVYRGPTSSTVMGYSSYYDEEGVYHQHNMNQVSTSYSCSNGHWWNQDSPQLCPADNCSWNEDRAGESKMSISSTVTDPDDTPRKSYIDLISHGGGGVGVMDMREQFRRSSIESLTSDNLLDATEEFMTLAKQLEEVGFPDSLLDPVRMLRRNLLEEEYEEYILADESSDPVEVLDALMDIVVIAWGSALKYFGPEKVKRAALEVARTNLAKVKGPGLPIFREDGKVIKPEGWQPPDIASIVNDE